MLHTRLVRPARLLHPSFRPLTTGRQIASYTKNSSINSINISSLNLMINHSNSNSNSSQNHNQILTTLIVLPRKEGGEEAEAETVDSTILPFG